MRGADARVRSGVRNWLNYASTKAYYNLKDTKEAILIVCRTEKEWAIIGVPNLSELNKSLVKIANVKSYKIPEKWEGYVAYLLDEIKVEKNKKTICLQEWPTNTWIKVALGKLGRGIRR